MTDHRRAELAKIHIARAQLQLDDDAYRDMLWTVARARSAADLDSEGRHQVLEHLKARGFRGRRKGRSRPGVGRVRLVRKIRAQLRAAGRQDAYADGIAQRMFHVDRYEWCDRDQLHRIVAALTYDAQRHGR
jgi:phage gp16-like protein